MSTRAVVLAMSGLAVGLASVAQGQELTQLPLEGNVGQVTGFAGWVYYKVATGEQQIIFAEDGEPGMLSARATTPIWMNNDYVNNGQFFHFLDGQQHSDGRSQYNSLGVDWGDVDPGARIDGIAIDYGVPSDYQSGNSQDPRIYGMNMFYVMWGKDNGRSDTDAQVLFKANLTNLPGSRGPLMNTWRVLIDLQGVNEFTIATEDEDGDGRSDIGFGYSFRQMQTNDPRNLGKPRTTIGPLLVLPGNAGGIGSPRSRGVEDALDWYNSLDASFNFNTQTQVYTPRSSSTYARRSYVDTYFFGNGVYASYWTELYGLPGRSQCLADFNNDGFADAFDYDDYVACFEGLFCPPNRTADVNGDGFPDAFDYDDFVAAFEQGCP